MHDCERLHERFDPRSREGSDLQQPMRVSGDKVSIRAPAKGATRDWRAMLRVDVSFDPRSREGSDLSRSPQTAGTAGFDPRSREGSDRRAQQVMRAGREFRSALPRRERPLQIVTVSPS